MRIRSTRQSAARIAAAASVAAFALSAGCVTSPGRAQYTALTTHRVEPGPATSDELAAAFGLDDYQTSSSALATADRDDEQ